MLDLCVQEWMEGGDLMQRLQATNKAGQRLLGWYSRGRSILLDIARGLHYLHRHNLTREFRTGCHTVTDLWPSTKA